MRGKRASTVFLCALFGSACTTTDEREVVGSVRQGILDGTSSDSNQDATVMLVHQKPGADTRGICTAALVAPRLVLTARHCVADANESVACDVDGTPLLGGQITQNHQAADLFVFVGKDRPLLDPTQWKPSGQGLEIIDDKSGTLCNHDLALVLLKEPILNAPIASMRLDRDVSVGEKLLTVGWGVSSGEVEPSQRQQRGGVAVKRVGPDEAIPVLTKSEFLFDESICLGDSGGPIYAEGTKAIVGVVSRGGNGADGRNGGPAVTCVDADNVGTKLAPFRDLVLEAFRRAGAEPRLEPPPEDDTCSVMAVGTRTRGGTSLGVALILALASVARRRRLAR